MTDVYGEVLRMSMNGHLRARAHRMQTFKHVCITIRTSKACQGNKIVANVFEAASKAYISRMLTQSIRNSHSEDVCNLDTVVCYKRTQCT